MDFEDKLYACGPPPVLDKSEWLNVKNKLGLEFPNLPYLIDGDVKIVQSVAILRYLGRKYGLTPKSEQESQRVDVIEQQLLDWRQGGTNVFYNADFAKLADDYRNGLIDKISALSGFLGNRQWLAGDTLTYVDFLAYEWLDVHRTFAPGLLQGSDNLEKYVQRFESLPNVKKYMNSNKFMKWPINNTVAMWGSITVSKQCPN